MASAQRTREQLAALPCCPVRIDSVFDDPDAIFALLRRRGPYPTITAYHHLDGTSGIGPWFRTRLDDGMFLDNPVFIEAARKAFSAGIVRPTRCELNLNGPMAASGTPHLDAATFRGIAVPRSPVWLVYNMAASGLFEQWLVPLASGLAWFWRGEGGEFEFWPSGDRDVLCPPLWNEGLVCDNEYTWHSVGAIGPLDTQRRLAGRIAITATLHAAAGGGWEIREDNRLVARLEPDDVRISILWKANVFRDEEHLASFDDPALDLDVGRVVEIYLEDLDAKGLRPERPADPLADSAWRQLLEEAYPPPFATG